MAKRSLPKVMLLVAPNSPMTRMRELQSWLADLFGRPLDAIEIVRFSGEPETPSSLVAERNVRLFADGAITGVTDSLRFARDWAEKWFQPRNAPPALWQCKMKPQRGNRSARTRRA